MDFTIQERTVNDCRQLILASPDNSTQVIILPDYGALLHAFIVNNQGQPFNVIDNYADAADIAANLSMSYKSSKLSPFVCRIAGAQYPYEGQTMEFAARFVDGSAIHGLLFNKPFRKIGSFTDDGRASVLLKYVYKQEDDGYPFDYACEIRYTLFANNTLQIQTTVTNLDELTLPMADGWHPYFTLGGTANEWLLQFASDTMLEFDDRLVPTGNKIKDNRFTEPFRLGDTQLDNCFELDPLEGQAACVLRNDATGLQLSLFPDKSYPYLQLYTPPHRKSIAIENLSAAPDAFNNGMGLVMLKPGHTETFTVYYQVACG